MNFGQYIKKRRLELGMTQAQLSKKIGVAQNYITYLENNDRNPSNEVIRQLATTLDLPLRRLYFLANPDVEKIIPERTPQKGLPLSPLLKSLAKNKILRAKHNIVDADIQLLSSIQARGEIKRIEDYVYLLMTIRQIFQE